LSVVFNLLSPNRPTPASPSRGFTLIELLVVIAVIMLLAGIVTFSLRGGSPGLALRGAQSEFATLVAQARGKAQLEGEEARLVFHVDPAPAEIDRYLRFAGVIYWDPTADGGTGAWIPVGSGTTLSAGVYFVPPNETSFPATHRSIFDSDSPMQIAFESPTARNFAFIRFSPRGTRVSADPQRIVIGQGRIGQDGTGVEFIEPNSALGVLIRRYGVPVMLNEMLVQ